MNIFKRKKKLALIWIALNLTFPGGTIEVYDVMRFVERVVGKKRLMKEWRKYLRDDKKGIKWLRNKLKGEK